MSNQRRSFRIAVAAEQRGAKLRHGGRDYKVVLEDESAGGFAVIVDGALLLKSGDKLPLFTNSGWSIVRVVYSTCQGDHTRVGFERVEDLPDLKELNEVKGSWRSYAPGADCRGIGWSACCGLLLIAAAGIGWLGYSYRPRPKPASGRPIAVDGAQASPLRRFSKEFQERWKAAEKAGTRIELTGAQQLKIGEILKQAEQEILELRSKGRNSAVLESERMQAAEAAILAVLDEKQRSLWDQLAATSDRTRP